MFFAQNLNRSSWALCAAHSFLLAFRFSEPILKPFFEEPSLGLWEKRGLLDALRRTGGDKLAAARLLGVGKSTFYRKLKNHGIT